MAKIDLKGNPFFLNDDQIKWVEDTLANMTIEKKAGQVFCPMGLAADPGLLGHMIHDIGVGAMMYRPSFAKDIAETHKTIQDMAEIPLLLAANTEAGGNGLAFEGTTMGKPMAVAATGDVEDAYRMGYVACAEGAALGLNWSFAPIVDIDMNFHSPITNVRTFGSDVDRVAACGAAYMRAADENHVAVAIKHFPGDGVDERDQHILTSVNSLSTEEWDATYGKVYSSLIEKGAKTVMVGQIAQPAYARAINPSISKKDALRPATLSKEIIGGLLREKLGFNGMISTDATPMLGFTTAMPRKDAIPAAIAAGCDMILFNKSLDEDYAYLLEGIRSGAVSEERLDEAVTRILATKASLKLPEKKANGTIVPADFSVVGCDKFKTWAKEVADKAITLVRDDQKLLPISTKKFKRVYLNVIQRTPDPDHPLVKAWKEAFEKEGFEVTVRDRTTTITVADFADIPGLPPKKAQMFGELYRGVEDMKKDYDLYVYVCNIENASNNTTMRLDWNVVFGLGDDAPWFAREIPVMMISTCCPYHLYDAPMIDTYINAYSEADDFRAAVMDKIMGRSEFKGVSPVDPFCGKDYI